MAGLEILNLDCFTTSPDREKWLNKARGYSQSNDWGAFNGGILNPQREHLRIGQNYYRFVPRAKTPEQTEREYKAGGSWWIDAETLKHIYGRFRITGPNSLVPHSSGPASSTFREWLALTYEGNMIEEFVVAQLQVRLDCYSGFGRIMQGRDPLDTRAFGYAPHLSNLFTIKQLYIPELSKHLKLAFPAYEILQFSQIDQYMRDMISGAKLARKL